MNEPNGTPVAGPTILVVEDEAPIAAAIAARLRSENFIVEVAPDGLIAIETFRRLHPDLIVLDLMLPGMDGLEVCRRVQADAAGGRSVPVLMLTARDDETDLLVGLGVGADDYMTKPFSPRELVARIRALLRRYERAGGAAPPAVRLGRVELDPAARRVRRDGEDVHLTPTEFDLLACLAGRPDVVHSREELLLKVWGHRDGYLTRTVDSHVQALRRKLGPEVIRTVHGIGYAATVSGSEEG
jgi:DNA-binding response OmpR family regulator